MPISGLLKKCYGSIHKGKEIDLNLFGMNQSVCRECKKVYNRNAYQIKKIKPMPDNIPIEKRDPKETLLENVIWNDITKQISKSMNGSPILFKDYQELIKTHKRDLWVWIKGIISNGIYKGMHRGNYGRRERQWRLIYPTPILPLNTLDNQLQTFHYTKLKPQWSKSKGVIKESTGVISG